MKRIALLFVLGFAVAAGCVPTLNPVYTDRDLVFDPALVGFWTQQDSPATWRFTKSGDKEYELVYTDNHGQSGRFQARLANVGGVRFLDLFPIKDDVPSNEFYKFHLMPIHTAYVVRQTTPHPQLAGFDLNWLNEYLTERPDALPHSTYNGQRLITASTEELQAFLLEHQEQFSGVFELMPVEQ
jgi:hypothetical protein